ncbi:MAG: hypothetical protein GY797_07945 [Deltaproteobacteria bacterium]|nr:hypothetical protein [Deltaproteobacteria bacterium]MCP5007163.1 hypothetical protein [Planctomycetota bacterium]
MIESENNKEIYRLKYHDGQVLTHKDFMDQQEYHINKLNQVLKSFPPGIIKGLEVEIDGNEVVILPGLAVDEKRNHIMVLEEVRKSIILNKESKKENTFYIGIRSKDERVDGGTSWERCTRIQETYEIIFIRKSKSDEDSNGTGILAEEVRNKDSNEIDILAKEVLDKDCEEIVILGVIVENDEKKYDIVLTERNKSVLFYEEDIKFQSGDKGHRHIGNGDGNQLGENALLSRSVTSEKIAPETINNSHFGKIEILESMIKDFQVTSPKINKADNKKDRNGQIIQDIDKGSGIKTGHITNKAVTIEKLDLEAKTYPKKGKDPYKISKINFREHLLKGNLTKEKLKVELKRQLGVYAIPEEENVVLTCNLVIKKEKKEDGDIRYALYASVQCIGLHLQEEEVKYTIEHIIFSEKRKRPSTTT